MEVEYASVEVKVCPFWRDPIELESHGHCFWDAEGLILIDIMLYGQTINSDVYIRTLKTLQKLFRRVWPHKNVAEILLQCGNTATHKFEKQEAITELQRTLLPCPLYSPHLDPSRFHLFGALEGAICGKRLGSDDEVTEEVAASTEVKLVKEGDRWPFFLLTQGCWSDEESFEKQAV